MRFEVEDTLTEQQVRLGLNYVVKDGIASQVMAILTGGAFLVAFAVKLGASNFVIGLLAAVGPLAQLLQLPSILLVEKIRNRRRITVVMALLGRIWWVAIALVPLLPAGTTRLALLLLSISAASAFGAVSGCSWNSWMHELVPQNILGKFFSKRMRIAAAVGIAASLAGAVYLDGWEKILPHRQTQAYSILFLAGFAVGVLGIYFLAKTPEPRMAPTTRKMGVLHLIAQPFRDENFRKLIAFLGSWNFAVNLAAPFFMVYMLRRLGLSMSFIIGLSILSQMMNFAFLRIWGRFTDRFSNKSVLAICGPLFMFSILAWTFTTMPQKYVLTVPLLIIIHVVIGLSSAGVSLASGNIGLKLAPKGQATAYLAANTVVNSLAAGIAPILGGKFADLFADRTLTWTLKYTGPAKELSLSTLDLQQWDFFFVLAFLIGLYSLHRLTMIKETGEVEEKIVINELFAEVRGQVRTLSSVEGLRQMLSFPFSLIRNIVRKERNNEKGRTGQEAVP